jgi:hypothetical protein
LASLRERINKKLVHCFFLSVTLWFGIFSAELEAGSLTNRFYVVLDGGGVLCGDFIANSRKPDLQINDMGRSWLYGAGIGLALGKDFRLEAKGIRRHSMRYQYFSEAVDTIDLMVGKLQNSTLTLGLYYQLFHLNRSTPYIGLGGGYSQNKVYDNWRLVGLDEGKALSLNNISQKNACYFVSAGTWIDIVSQFLMDISASYVFLGRVGPQLTNRARIDNIAVFELTLSLVYRFP